MPRIWKYNLEPHHAYPQPRTLPARGRIVAVDWDARHVPEITGLIAFWVEFDSDREKVLRQFRVAVTGEVYDAGWWQIGTVIDRDRGLVLHVLERESDDEVDR